MAGGAIALAGALLFAGVPAAVLLGLTPALLCLAMHVAIGHGDPHGEELLTTARKATARELETPVLAARPPIPTPLGSRHSSDNHG